MASSVYQVDLADGISGPAQQAARALKSLQSRIESDRTALRALEREMKALQKAGNVNADAVKTLQAAIDKRKASIDRGQAAFVKLSSGQLGAAASAANFRGQLREASTALQALPSQLGGPIDRLSKFGQVLSGAVSPAIVLRVALVALIAVLAAAAIALGRYAIAQADARRAEALHIQQLTKFKLGSEAAKALQRDIDAVSATVSIGRDEVANYAAQLYASGVRGQALRDALQGAAITASALGDKAGAAFVRAASGPNQTAESIRRLAETAKTKLGGVVQAQMLTLEVQAKKSKEGFATLFSGLDLDPYLAALKDLRAQFSTTTVAGRAIKTLVDLFGQPIVNAVTAAVRAFKAFFVQVLIGVYEIVLAYQLVALWYEETFGKSKTGNTFASFFRWFQLGRVLVYVLVAAFGALAISVIASTYPFLILAGLFVGFIILLQNIADWSLKAGAVFYDVVQKMVEVGSNLIAGLVDGLRKGWENFKGNVASIANKVGDTFKDLFGIGSPSKVFVEYGAALSEGLAVGVDQSAPKAQSAVSGIVDVPSVPAAGVANEASGGAASRSLAVSIGSITIQTTDADAPSIAQSLRRELEKALETLALETGALPAGAQ